MISVTQPWWLLLVELFGACLSGCAIGLSLARLRYRDQEIDNLTADVDVLWEAVFGGDDPDREEIPDAEPSNVIAIGRDAA